MTPEADETVLLLGEAIASVSGISEDWQRVVAVFTIQPGGVDGQNVPAMTESYRISGWKMEKKSRWSSAFML